jgi:hypothetical protein
MATEAELLTQLARLKSARAKGARSVSYGDRRVEYRDISELNAAITEVEKELAGVQGNRIVRGYRFVSDKAL